MMISGYPSAAGRAQDRESSPAKDRRSTTVPRNQVGREISNEINSTLDDSWNSPVDVLSVSGQFLVEKKSRFRIVWAKFVTTNF